MRWSSRSPPRVRPPGPHGQAPGANKYAEAGIPHYWCIEDEDGSPVVHGYELDEPTGAYAPAGIFRDTLTRPVPFPLTLDLTTLTPPTHP